ncbi:hypothetical protein [Nonomuraea sp. NPDC050691]|uniref:hypothetical protein n=1 Tax=Nonomuraea sp. NPDC050691 TaxID=3155661 RepID=UPI0033D49B22
MGPKVLYLLNISNNPERLSAASGWVVADTLLSALTNAGAVVTLGSPAPVRDARVGFWPMPMPARGRAPRAPRSITDALAAVCGPGPDEGMRNGSGKLRA